MFANERVVHDVLVVLLQNALKVVDVVVLVCTAVAWMLIEQATRVIIQ